MDASVNISYNSVIQSTEVNKDMIDASDALKLDLNTTRERDFQHSVVELAELYGWMIYHTYDSRRSNPGFPDLVMVRDNRVIFAELKTMKGKVTKHQERWLEALAKTQVEVKLWRPSDINDIEEVLR